MGDDSAIMWFSKIHDPEEVPNEPFKSTERWWRHARKFREKGNKRQRKKALKKQLYWIVME